MKEVHGEYLITLSGQVMLIHAYGPWNLECVMTFGRDYELEIERTKLPRWADIVVLNGESLLIPQAELLLQQQVKAVRKMGLSHAAIVTAASSVKASAEGQLHRLYSSTGIQYQFFTDYHLANLWLAEQNFMFDPSSELTHFRKAK